MNDGTLNSYSLNSSAVDVTVRSVVLGTAFAMADVLTRVMRRSPVNAFGQAQATPKSLRLARNPQANEVRAVAMVTSRRLVRDVVAGLAQAKGDIGSGFIRMKIAQVGQALGAVVSRVIRREAVVVPAQAMASPTGKRLARQPVDSQPQALGTVVGTVDVRHYFSEVMAVAASALGTVFVRALVRHPVNGAGEAQGVVSGRSVLRSPTSSTAQAIGFVGGSVMVVVPFDEVARPENTFVVNFEDNVFFVR